MEVYYVNFAAQATDLDFTKVQVTKAGTFKRANVSHKRLLLSLAFLFVVLSAQLMLRVVITEKGYEIEKLRMVALSNDAELRELGFTYAFQGRPAEILTSARAKLGMEMASPKQIRKMSY
ncbi:MAG: hypothetical protein IT292_06410 [Deltaproteobacteria bacterium]|nr:hypothetical protein [Deltaproteobacteria bacterium]